ncbi:hypothetical protein HHI36_012167 [Cryptolaemus montrouzieri]|uniref:Uncharacterized protein n=1 Tax=Cryptolaemus montrouzieri TaxID=559131 RepID=A0ABD2NE39_9CUCU
MTDFEDSQLKNKRRTKERKRKYRENIKLLKQTGTTTGEQSPSSLGSFSCKQTLGKAVSRVKGTLPSSPTKKIAVMRKLVLDFLDILGDDSFSKRPSRKSNVIHALSDDHKGLVTEFYQRDDIGRQAPGIKDVKSGKDLKSGTEFCAKSAI